MCHWQVLLRLYTWIEHRRLKQYMCQENPIRYTKHSSGQLYTLMYHAEHDGSYVGYIRGELCQTIEDFFREVSSSMRFPYYFGRNWAAFDECIQDLEWLKFTSILIVVENFNLVFQSENNVSTNKDLLIKHLSYCAEYWKSKNIPISIILNQ